MLKTLTCSSFSNKTHSLAFCSKLWQKIMFLQYKNSLYSSDNTLLESPPCRCATPPPTPSPTFSLMMCCMHHKQAVGARTGLQGGLWAHEEEAAWLVVTQHWQKMPFATVPQGNEESRRGQHGGGERKKSREGEKEGECYFWWRLP